MKTILLVSLAALGVVAINQSFNGPQLPLKPAKEEFPEVIIKTNHVNRNRYSEPEFNIAKACTRDIPPGYSVASLDVTYSYVDDKGETQSTRHCIKCGAGVYSLHDDATFKTCSFCGEKE